MLCCASCGAARALAQVTASQIFLSHMQIIWLGGRVNTLWKLMCSAEQAGRICGRHIYKRKTHFWTTTAGMDTIQHSMFPHLVFWWRHWTHIFLRCLIRSSSGGCPSDIIFILIKPFSDCLVPCGWEGLSSQKLPCWMLVCNSGHSFVWWVCQKCCFFVYTQEISCYRVQHLGNEAHPFFYILSPVTMVSQGERDKCMLGPCLLWFVQWLCSKTHEGMTQNK